MTRVRTCLNCQTGEGMIRFEDKTLIIEHAGMKRVMGGLALRDLWRSGIRGR
jgi:hypothetical protein